MLAETTEQQFREHLHDVGLRSGMDVVVHSGLIAFGRIAGGGSTVLRALRAVVGDDATIVFPTYTFNVTAEVTYDPKATVSCNAGVLGELARHEAGAVRSLSPVHNHVAIGPRADLLSATPPTVSLGPGSDFEKLYKAQFHLLLLGCQFSEGCTYLHHLEAMVGVPYRAWIDLPRRVKHPASAVVEDVTLRYYARCNDAVQERFDVVIDELAAGGSLGQAAAPYGQSYLVALEDLDRCGRALLARDPFALVTCPQEIAT